jgi:hypothetical protein
MNLFVLMTKIKFQRRMMLHTKKTRVSLSGQKVSNLKQGCMAHRKQQEALSPNKKTQIVNNNIAAQHKHRNSLSPELKTQGLTIDAAVHKKQYKLLPSKKGKTYGNQGLTMS